MSFSAIPRWWRLLLVASLAANLAVAGLVIGAALDPDRGPRRDGPEIGAGAPLFRGLPDERRRAVIEALRGDTSRDDRRAERRARFETLIAALTADPFRPEAVSQALSEQRRFGAERLAAAEEALIAQLAAMTPAERQAFADQLASRVRRR